MWVCPLTRPNAFLAVGARCYRRRSPTLVCASKGNGTTLVVSVFSDLMVGSEIDAVDVVVAGGELRYPFALGSGSGRSTLPVHVALVPGGATDLHFEVQAVGLLAGAQVVAQTATISFVPGQKEEIALFLARSCVSVPPCASGFTCDNGSCVPEASAGTRRTFSSLDAGIDVPTDGPEPADEDITGAAGAAGAGGAGQAGGGTGGGAAVDASAVGGTDGGLDSREGGAGGQGCQAGGAVVLSFLPAVNYVAGMAPQAVAVGDLDGNGTIDMAVANNGSNDVSVLLNQGHGAFGTAVSYPTGLGPDSIAVGDLNGDGKVDLAVANFSTGRPGAASGDLSILLNAGSATFAAAVNYDSGGFTASIALGDLNGDGIPDLATADEAGAHAFVTLNTGNGTFGAPGGYAVGMNPVSMAIGDLNGDRQADLAVANNASGTVSVILNAGNASFATAVSYAVGMSPTSVVIGDLNGDGKADLAVANGGSGNVSVLLNKGDGSLTEATTFAAGAGPSSIAVGDLNGDGRLDLAVANGSGGNVSVLVNDGNGLFAPAVSLTTGAGPTSVAIGDVNDDCKPDLAVTNSSSGNVSVLLNSSR